MTKHVVVLVLGDLGRSPRMQYHAYSLAKLNESILKDEGVKVSLVGYEGEQTMQMIAEQTCVRVYRLKLWDFPFLRFLSILHAVAKGLALVLAVLIQLIQLRSYHLIIIQNPPCLPVLVAAIFISWFNGSKILLDWHNLGFAMFQERLGEKHPLVHMAKFLEKFLTSFATHHICVSKAMKVWLKTNFNVHATVLYDRPPKIFLKGLITPAERHELLLRLNLTDAALFPNRVPINVKDARSNECTIQTCASNTAQGEKVYSERVISQPAAGSCLSKNTSNRAALIMSCTSWTPDEDFDIFLEALVLLEAHLHSLDQSALLTNDGSVSKVGFRRVCVVVTGKGPMKLQFERKVKDYECDSKLGVYVVVRTAWLAPEDYPALLRCADLGVSLHTSTSGLDLPMKVLDMFGSAVPVCAVRFPTLHELVQDHVNGLSFAEAKELFQQMTRLLVQPTCEDVSSTDTVVGSDVEAIGCELSELANLKVGASQIASWEDNWSLVMASTVEDILSTNYA